MRDNISVSPYCISAVTNDRGTVRAERFRAAVREAWSRNLKALPDQLGGERAKRRKTDPDDTLRLSIDDAAAIVSIAKDPDAVQLVRAFLHDARKGESIAVERAADALMLAETEAAASFAHWLIRLDELRRAGHVESRRFHDEYTGAQSRMKSAMNCAGMGL